MSIFGWSLPPGCSTLPGEEPEHTAPRCRSCGAFLPAEPTGQRRESFLEEDFGPRLPVNKPDLIWVRRCDPPWPTAWREPWWTWRVFGSDLVFYWSCRRCGRDSCLL